MKCFIVSYNGLSNAGGVERVCYYISELMRELGYEIVIVDKLAINDLWLNKIIKKVVHRNVMIFSCVLSSIYVRSNITKGDIVITNGFNCPFVNADIQVVHGTMQGYSKAIGANVKLKDKWTWLFEKMASKNAKRILSVSRNAIAEVQRLYTGPISKYSILNNMVDQDIFKPTYKPHESRTLNILYCGRLDYGKGIYKMKELCEYIGNKGLDAKFIIAANNPHNKELFETYPFVELNIGLDVSQLNNFYNRGDVVYFPSMYEGFEMVTLEALSAGVPVLGNNVGAVSELYSRNEPGVDLIEGDSPDVIYKQLSMLSTKYSDFESKLRLHNYYANNYGKTAYKQKLKHFLSEITKG